MKLSVVAAILTFLTAPARANPDPDPATAEAADHHGDVVVVVSHRRADSKAILSNVPDDDRRSLEGSKSFKPKRLREKAPKSSKQQPKSSKASGADDNPRADNELAELQVLGSLGESLGNNATQLNYERVGEGFCKDKNGDDYSFFYPENFSGGLDECEEKCECALKTTDVLPRAGLELVKLRGLAFASYGSKAFCLCYTDVFFDEEVPKYWFDAQVKLYNVCRAPAYNIDSAVTTLATGEITSSTGPNDLNIICYKVSEGDDNSEGSDSMS